MSDTVEYEFDLSGVSVMLGLPCYRGVFPAETTVGLIAVSKELTKRNISAGYIFERENALVDTSRNRIVRQFLESGMQKLLFIDDDIIFKWEDVERLICWSTKFPIVAASYPARQVPTLYYIQFDPDNQEWNEYGLLKINGCGLGFTIIDRSVFEQMAPSVEEFEDREIPTKRFFRTGLNEQKKYCGEDMMFFHDAVKAGFDVWLDPLINLGHFGNYIYRGDLTTLPSYRG